MKKSIECNFGDIIFCINTFNKEDFNKQLEHVREFYIPCRIPKKEVKTINIDYSTDRYIFEKYLEECKKRKGKLYQSFENQVHKEIEVPNKSKRIYLIDNEEYICIKDDDCNYKILTDGREQGVKWPFRILRELLVREREDKGNLFMHGTGISLNESGILLLGNSGSGKTTLAVEMISEDMEEKGFVSNDRIFMRDGKMQYFPIPVVFASGTAKNNRYLDEYFKETRLYEKRTGRVYECTSNNDKVPVPLTDIEKIFEGIKLEPQKEIDTIIFPKINLDMGSSFKIEEMDTRKKYTSLDRTCFTPFDSESLRLEWIRKRKKNIDEITENKYDIIKEIMREKQLLQLEYGLESNKKEIIDDIIR